ncbi:LOW QUALITY PROTEIN: sterile alpha motif domain-containing protein 3 [Liasis olivaceus]
MAATMLEGDIKISISEDIFLVVIADNLFLHHAPVELFQMAKESDGNRGALLAFSDRMVQQLIKKIGHQTVLMDLIKTFNTFFINENHNNGSINQRLLKQKKNMKHVLARQVLQTHSHILPVFPYDVKCVLAEGKYPDHSMEIWIIEFLQADMIKYCDGSL